MRKKVRTLIGLIVIMFPVYLFCGTSGQETKPNESSAPTRCDGKLDVLHGLATVQASLTGFRYGELPMSGEQLRTGETGIDRASLQAAVLDGVRKAVQEAGYKLAEKDPDWSVGAAYFNYWETEGNEKIEAGKTYRLTKVKRLELTFTTKSTGILCRTVLSPKEDVRMTMTGDGMGRIKTKYNAEDIPKEITKILQGLIPKKTSTP